MGTFCRIECQINAVVRQKRDNLQLFERQRHSSSVRHNHRACVVAASDFFVLLRLHPHFLSPFHGLLLNHHQDPLGLPRQLLE